MEESAPLDRIALITIARIVRHGVITKIITRKDAEEVMKEIVCLVHLARKDRTTRDVASSMAVKYRLEYVGRATPLAQPDSSQMAVEVSARGSAQIAPMNATKERTSSAVLELQRVNANLVRVPLTCMHLDAASQDSGLASIVRVPSDSMHLDAAKHGTTMDRGLAEIA
jgi:hypothetical protein